MQIFYGRLGIEGAVRISKFPALRIVRLIRTLVVASSEDADGRVDILEKEKANRFIIMPSAEKVSLGGKCDGM